MFFNILKDMETDIFYHGSPWEFNEFKTPNETGIIRKSEQGRKKNLDKVFLSKSINYSKLYTEGNGYIYVCRAKAVKYSTSGGVDIFTADKDNIEILHCYPANLI